MKALPSDVMPFMHDPPPALAARFDGPALVGDPSTLALVESTGTILWVNLAWYRFARANGAPQLARRFAVGTSYLDGISGELREAFGARLAACAREGAPFEQRYECSSPERERHFVLRALPLEGGAILLSHTLIVERALSRDDAPPIEGTYTDPHGLILQCSHCRRVKRARREAWDWVSEWVASPRPNTSHGLCPLCVGYYFSASIER